MNYPPTFRSNKGPRRRTGGFTIVEMMTAIAVLSIMMLMLGQTLQMVSQAWMNGERNVNNFTKARAMLDLFAKDIQAGVFRSDLAAFPKTGPGVTIDSFYTKRPGVFIGAGTERYVSLVQYNYSPDQTTTASTTTLQRGDMSIAWSAAASFISFGDTTDFNGNTVTPRDAAPGVVDYKILFVYADGSNSLTYPSATGSPLRAVGLTLLAVDDQTLKQLTVAQVQALRTAFDGAATGTRSVKADWANYFNTGMAWQSYPKNLGLGLKIFERYVPVTGF